MSTNTLKPAGPAGAERVARPGLLSEAKQLSFWAENAAPVGLVVLVVVFSLLSGDFLTLGNIKAMLLAAAILIILSVAQAFIITTGGIDLSIAATMTLAAVGFGVGWAPVGACSARWYWPLCSAASSALSTVCSSPMAESPISSPLSRHSVSPRACR